MGKAPEFELSVTENGNGPVVSLTGDLDLKTVPELRACLRDFNGQRVTLDFTDVTFMDSTAISVLMAAKKRALLNGGEVVLHGVQPAQMRVFEITGLLDDFDFDGQSTLEHTDTA
jgi:anti-anti-sigma factor